jgi:SAM-dependent methyltransferase
MSEVDEIVERYERRKDVPANLYSLFRPEVLATFQARQRTLLYLFKKNGVRSLSNTSVLEIGCGSGVNLLELIWLGANPQNLIGNELLRDRIDRARITLPKSLQLLPGDASKLSIRPSSFDFVYQSTVFSSILDDDLQTRIAELMWHWARPGGGILWYDFIYDNPKNRDVRGVALRRVRELFPKGHLTFRRVALAPPISRRVCKISPMLYKVFDAFPVLRSHVFCLIEKRPD